MTKSADTLAFSLNDRSCLDGVDVRFQALLDEITATFAASADRFGHSGEFAFENFVLLQRHGLPSLTVPRSLGGSAAAGRVQVQHAGQIKQLLSRNAIRAVELATEAAGNPGPSRKHPLERHFRDVLCSRIHTPQDDLALSAVGRAAFAQFRETL